MPSTENDENIFKILISTDNHLGYKEKDPEIGNDSFTAFEEVFKIAKELDVDFVLLGGDLFHENKPTRQARLKCINILRKYCLGDRPVSVQFLSDASENFRNLENNWVNYEDPNINISIPVFSIHGNHDDPSDFGQFCALDELSAVGLVNYFGRSTDLKNIQISPILLGKGTTKLAIYGLSHIKDERLFRLYREKKVTMLRPREDTDSWFNIMVVHQNRTKHGPTCYLPEQFIEEFIDLVVWGHEHESLVQAETVQKNNQQVYITQPGSSVATSLCEGESVEKHIALLEVRGTDFKIKPIKLETVRPLIHEDLILADVNIKAGAKDLAETVETYVEEKVNQLIEQSQLLLTGNPRQPVMPLIRLRVEYSEEAQVFNKVRFGQMFRGKVANPETIILFRKKKENIKKEGVGMDHDVLDGLVQGIDLSETRAELLVEKYFMEEGDAKQKLSLLTEKGLGAAVNAFIEKDSKDAISVIVNHQIDRLERHLETQELDVNDETIVEGVSFFRDSKRGTQADLTESESALTTTVKTKKQPAEEFDGDISPMSDEPEPAPKRGRGRARATRAAATTRGTRGRGRAKAAVVTVTPPKRNSTRTSQSRSTQQTMTSYTRNKGASKGFTYDDSDSDGDNFNF